MNRDTRSGTEAAIRNALTAIGRYVASGRFGDHDGDQPLNYLDATIPPQHKARMYLMKLLDVRRRWPIVGSLDGPDDVIACVELIGHSLDTNPITFPTFDNSEQLAQFKSYWHESATAVRLVDRGDGITGAWEVDTAMGAGHMENTLVFYDADGEPVGQVSVGILLEMAANNRPSEA